MMVYRGVQPYTREEAEVAFAQGTSAEITDALLGVTYYVDDWQWVQTACLALLNRPDTQIQWVSIQCLGHLATFHKMLDLAIVLPALQAHMSDQALAPVLYDALDDISGVKDTSYFEKNWDELPERMQEALIEAGVFNSLGKRIRKRNFIAIDKSETGEQVSGDRELVERLNQQCGAPVSHDWEEYYDEQGRLLRLSLEDLELAQLPMELWQCTSLQELDLSGNQLSSLPVEIGMLVNLESLALCMNQLSSLPAELGQLINLQELFLDNNQLNNLPAELGQLVNLLDLDLSENQLTNLPAELGQLGNLLSLYVHKNQLSSLPAELGQLINLRTLMAQCNQLSSLPAELGQLVNLKWLSLDENQLSSLPAELGNLVKLHALHLDQNPSLQIPPPEVVRQGIPAVLAYLRALL